MLKHIVVPVDGSDQAKRAVASAAELSQLAGAKLTLINVIAKHAHSYLPDNLRSFDEVEHVAYTEEDQLMSVSAAILRDAAAMIDQSTVVYETAVLHGHAAHEIVAFANRNDADLIVMGSRGLSDLKGLLLGSVSHRVSQMADCAVMLVK